MQPDEYAAGLLADIDIHATLSTRSLAALDGQIGASSFDCRERLRLTLGKANRTDSPPKWSAHVGTALDHWIKQVRAESNPDLILDAELTVDLPNGYPLTVHPDEIDPAEPSVTDYKTKNGLAGIRAGFADDSHRFQRHLQYYAAWKAGLVPEAGLVRNVFFDRSGKDPNPHVEQEPFSMDVVGEATEFLNDALYALKHNEEASKDKPRYFCRVACEFYTACRGSDVDVPLIADLETARRVEAFHAAKVTKAEAQELMEALRADGLEGLSGETDTVRIISTWVNATNRTPHWKVETEAIGEAS